MKKALLIFTLSFLLIPVAKSQNALDFDGTNDYVQTTFSGVSGSANRTFEAWIYVSSTPSSNLAISDYGANAVGSRNTFYVNANKQLGFISGGTNANIGSSQNAVPTGQWAHVAFVLNNGTGYLYVNGSQVGTGSLTTVNTPTGNNNLRIGQRVPGGSIPFNGIIDEVRIWNVARSASDIASSMNSEFCSIPTGLVAYYKLNSGTAGGSNAGVTTALDAVSANNGTLTNFSLSGTSSNWVTGKSLNAGSSTPGNATVTACDSYTSPSGNYTWTTSGNYVDTISSPTGCDSIVNIALTINQSSMGSLTATACNKYVSPSGNHTWITSGNYTDTLTNAIGCDSVLTIALTVNSVDTSVLVNGITLTSWAAGASYQWLDCNNAFAPISGANTQSYTATANGSYAVEINASGCVDTSACYAVSGIGIDENAGNSFRVFPNPAEDKITLSFENTLQKVELYLIDALGRVVVSKNYTNVSQVDLLLDVPAGVYFIRVKSADEIMMKKIEVH